MFVLYLVSLLSCTHLVHGSIAPELKRLSNDMRLLNSKIPISQESLRDAVKKNDIALVTQMVQSKDLAPDKKEASTTEETPLMIAINQNYLPVIDLLIFANVANLNKPLQYPDKNNPTYLRYKTPLMIAAEKNNTEALDKLLAAWVDVNSTASSTGETALMLAAANNAVNAIRFLIENGAQVNVASNGSISSPGQPVLWYAVSANAPEAVKVLLSANADPNAYVAVALGIPGASYGTILSAAIAKKVSSLIIKQLIEAKAEVNKKTQNDGPTPLMIAAYVDNVEALEKLLAAGADRTIKNATDKGKTALDYAKEKGHTEIIKLLSNA